MKLKKENFFEIVHELNLPRIVIDIFENGISYDDLDFRFSSIKFIYEWNEDNQEPYTKGGRVFPLWSDHSFSEIAAYDKFDALYKDIDPEEPTEFCDTYASWDELIFCKLAIIARDDDYAIDKIRKLAKLFQLGCPDFLIDFLQNNLGKGYDYFNSSLQVQRKCLPNKSSHSAN